VFVFVDLMISGTEDCIAIITWIRVNADMGSTLKVVAPTYFKVLSQQGEQEKFLIVSSLC
jgi:hypothetical protein